MGSLSLSKSHRKQLSELMTDILNDKALVKYAVKKEQDCYRYYSFKIKKDGIYYDCYINDHIIFHSITSFQLALLLCYNHLFEKNIYVKTKLVEFNKTLTKYKQELEFRKHKYRSVSEQDKPIYFTLMSESKYQCKKTLHLITRFARSL